MFRRVKHRLCTTTTTTNCKSCWKKAARVGLNKDEGARLSELVSVPQPQLSWAKKSEKSRLEIEPVALHIHERLSTQAILACAKKESPQKSLFADDEWNYETDLEFYRHDMDWANRLILGDSLSVMASLVGRENLAGKVQTIYMDPPYGIKFASNFQPKIGQRDVKDRDDDLTREPEMVRAYRDTWNLGVHSYLTYLRDRLTLSKALLTDSGSIFVQISDENLHRVRCVMDEVFGAENFVSVIGYRKTANLTSGLLPTSIDWIIWYCKDKAQIKYRQILLEKGFDNVTSDSFGCVEFPDGSWQRLNGEEKSSPQSLPKDWKLFGLGDLTSSHFYNSPNFEFEGNNFNPKKRYWSTSPDGLRRLAGANRLAAIGETLRYKRMFSDFQVMILNNVWDDIGAGTQSEARVYAVQTAEKAIERCILMTSDPGDLVFDPTCGSGTTAYVAENWGRRWITCDTSRVALAIARQRILTAKFDAYEFADDALGIKGNFKYKTVPHITLKSIAQNPHLDPIFETFNPRLTALLQTLNEALSDVSDETRRALKSKLAAIKKPSDAEKRRLDLPRFVVSPSGESNVDSPRFVVSPSGESTSDSPDGETTNLGLGGFEHWVVPFDVDDDYPDDLKRAVTEYRQLWREKMDAVNKAIADSAESETLYDKPIVRKNVVRVSGPFTVEAVQPPEMSLSAPQVLHPEIEEESGELPAFSVAQVQAKPPLETQNAASYIDNLIALLKADGLTFLGNRKIEFQSVEPFNFGSLPAHAVATWLDESGEQRAIVSFGPQYGAIGARQVEEVGRVAYKQGFDAAIFAGFAFEATASSLIEKGRAHSVSSGAHPARHESGDERFAQSHQQFATVQRVRLTAHCGQPKRRRIHGFDGRHGYLRSGFGPSRSHGRGQSRGVVFGLRLRWTLFLHFAGVFPRPKRVG